MRHAPAPEERMALWIPRWDIGTRLLFWNGSEVDEEASSQGQAREVDVKAAAKGFVRRFRRYLQGPVAEVHPPSLISAFGETGRIQQARDRASS